MAIMCHKSEIGVGKGNSFSNDGGASSRALVLLDGRQPAYCGDFERGGAGWDPYSFTLPPMLVTGNGLDVLTHLVNNYSKNMFLKHPMARIISCKTSESICSC
jgi:hypothetical protein